MVGGAALDCEHHAGMHLLENLSVLEVVDEAKRPMPDDLYVPDEDDDPFGPHCPTGGTDWRQRDG